MEIEIPIEREPINISQDTVIDLSTSQFPINADISLNGNTLTLTGSGDNFLNDIIVNSGTLQIDDGYIINLTMESLIAHINGGWMSNVITNDSIIDLNGGTIENIIIQDNNNITINLWLEADITVNGDTNTLYVNAPIDNIIINGNDNIIYNQIGSDLNIIDNGKNNSIK